MFSSCISFRWLDCTCNKLLQLHFCCSLLLTFIGCHSCWALALVPHAFPKHALRSITDLVAFINLPLSVKNVACETRPTKRGEVTDLVATTLYLLCDTNWVVTGSSIPMYPYLLLGWNLNMPALIMLQLISWEVDLMGVDPVGSWSIGSWFSGSWFRESWSRGPNSAQHVLYCSSGNHYGCAVIFLLVSVASHLYWFISILCGKNI